MTDADIAIPGSPVAAELTVEQLEAVIIRDASALAYVENSLLEYLDEPTEPPASREVETFGWSDPTMLPSPKKAAAAVAPAALLIPFAPGIRPRS